MVDALNLISSLVQRHGAPFNDTEDAFSGGYKNIDNCTLFHVMHYKPNVTLVGKVHTKSEKRNNYAGIILVFK